MRETPRKSANAKPAPAQKEPQPIEQKQESFKPSQNPQSQPRVGRRRPQDNPRSNEYERLMALVEELRQQFPYASDEQILEWAKKRLEFDSRQSDIWSKVAGEYDMPVRPLAPKQQNFSASNTPEWQKFADQHGVPRTVGRKAPQPNQPGQQPTQAAGAASDNTPAFIPSGINGGSTFNPEWGKKHGLVWDGSKWADGTAQQQEAAAAQAEQQFLAEKRRIELERLRMEFELDKLQKERDMSALRGGPALAGLLGGAVNQEPVRALGPGARMTY